MSLNHLVNETLSNQLVFTNTRQRTLDGGVIDMKLPTLGSLGQVITSNGIGQVFWNSSPIEPFNPEIPETIYPANPNVDLGTQLKPFRKVWVNNATLELVNPTNPLKSGSLSIIDGNVNLTSALSTANVNLGFEAGIGSGENSTNIGNETGGNSGDNCVNLGFQAGKEGCLSNSINIGNGAGIQNSGENSVHIGTLAGASILGGLNGTSSICLGQASGLNDCANNSIIINATGVALDTTIPSTFVVKPVRDLPTYTKILGYNTTSGEIFSSNPISSGGSSNIYLYNSSTIITPPPSNSQIRYNNVVQNNATEIYVSHLTRDGLDIDEFLALINNLSIIYIQDQNSSLNYIRYTVIGDPVVLPNDYVSIPVAVLNSAGTGATNFPNGHNIFMTISINAPQIDTRILALEEKTQNQTAVVDETSFTGEVKSTGLCVSAGFKIPGGTASDFLVADGTTSSVPSLTSLETKTQNQTAVVNETSFVGEVKSTGLCVSSGFKTPLGTASDFVVADGTTNNTVSTSSSVSSTDDTLVRMDGITGKIIQNSAVVLTDSRVMSNLNTVSSKNIQAETYLNDNSSFSMTLPNSNTGFVKYVGSKYDNTNNGKVLSLNNNEITPISLNFGDVVSTSTLAVSNSLTRMDGTTGKVIKTSSVVLNDTGNMSGLASVNTTELISNKHSNSNQNFSLELPTVNSGLVKLVGSKYDNTNNGKVLTMNNDEITPVQLIDDTTTSNDKLWSSSKTNSTIAVKQDISGNLTTSGTSPNITIGVDNITLGRFNTTNLASSLGTIVLGENSATNLVDGNYNIIIGSQAGDSVVGGDNICIGFGTDCKGLDNQVSIGKGAITANSNEICLGNSSITNIYNGGDGVCDLGSTTHKFKDAYISKVIATQLQANSMIISNPSSGNNLSINQDDMSSLVGGGNCLYGNSSGVALTTGSSNSFYGSQSGQSLVSTNHNTGIGDRALNVCIGNFNTAVGSSALVASQNNEHCVAVGYDSSQNLVSGNNCTSVGSFALARNLGSGNTSLGYNAGNTAVQFTNTTSLGANALPDNNNQVVLGNTSVLEVKSSGTYIGAGISCQSGSDVFTGSPTQLILTDTTITPTKSTLNKSSLIVEDIGLQQSGTLNAEKVEFKNDLTNINSELNSSLLVINDTVNNRDVVMSSVNTIYTDTAAFATSNLNPTSLILDIGNGVSTCSYSSTGISGNAINIASDINTSITFTMGVGGFLKISNLPLSNVGLTSGSIYKHIIGVDTVLAIVP